MERFLAISRDSSGWLRMASKILKQAVGVSETGSGKLVSESLCAGGHFRVGVRVDEVFPRRL